MSAPHHRASSSAIALREAFGDRKLPDISRKITACVACRKLKIRCQIDGGPPCTRCKKRGLPCAVNKSLQTILESDMSWKEQIDRKISGFEAAFSKIAGRLDCPELLDLLSGAHDDARGTLELQQEARPLNDPATPSGDPPQAWQVINDPESGPAVIPSTVVSALSPSAGINSPNGARDLVSQGLISASLAEACFDAYSNRLDHFVYRALDDHKSLQSIRRSSSLLTAVICAVGALHASPEHFSACYREFISLASSQLFSKRYTLDDIRALVIGGFWLHDISWTLIGSAVRMATEVRLHRCVIKPQPSNRDWYLQTRLFCLVFVCDHHLSVAYGRPPLTPRDFDYPTVSEALMNCEFATAEDSRLLSQVEIWSINTKIYYKVGIDTDEPIPESSLPQLQRLSIALDTWRADWGNRFSHSDHVGSYPRKGVRLHFHFAKLFLCSHAFRGAYNPNSTSYSISPEFEEFANLAIYSATSILMNIIDDVEFQSFLNGLPAYYDTMIAFAVVFLVKVLAKDTPAVRIDRARTYEMMEQLTTTLERITRSMSRHHLLSNIASSLRSVVDKGRQPDAHTPKSAPEAASFQAFDQNLFDSNSALLDPSEPGFITNFDFFGPHLGDFDSTFMDLSNS